ncbi:hypothetical protein J6590_093138 [Homalodisca vitripennis]|nr:hypothetical protein J6590_093138 [Homalodisca vitripennis]
MLICASVVRSVMMRVLSSVLGCVVFQHMLTVLKLTGRRIYVPTGSGGVKTVETRLQQPVVLLLHPTDIPSRILIGYSRQGDQR